VTVTTTPYPEALESAKRRAETVLARARAELCSPEGEDRMTVQMVESLERIERGTKRLEQLLGRDLLAWAHAVPAPAVAREIDTAADALESELRTYAELRQSIALG
jgi:hypothetical protein